MPISIEVKIPSMNGADPTILKRSVKKGATKHMNVVKKRIHVGKDKYRKGQKVHSAGTLRKSMVVEEGTGFIEIKVDENIASYGYYENEREGSKNGSPHRFMYMSEEEEAQLVDNVFYEYTKALIQRNEKLLK